MASAEKRPDRTHIVLYDLSGHKEYERLYEVLRSLGATYHSKKLESVWFVHTDLQAFEVRDKVLEVVEGTGSVFVQDTCCGSAHWSGMGSEFSEWFKEVRSEG